MENVIDEPNAAEKRALKKRHEKNENINQINLNDKSYLLLDNMFASMERKIIGKNYDEHFDNFNSNNVWSYKYKNYPIDQITLDYDKNMGKYIFSFPMKTGNINYTSYFDSYSDVLKYMNYVVNNYL